MRGHIVGAERLGAERQEVIVLRIAHRLGSSYERAHHVRRAQALGMTSARIEGLSGDPEQMSAKDALLVRAVDQIFDTGRVAAHERRVLMVEIGPKGLLDLMATVGAYVTLGAIVNTFDAPLDDVPPSREREKP